MEDKVCRIVSDIFNLDPLEVKQDLSFESLENWESLTQLNLILALEEEFNIHLSPADIQKIKSIQSIVSVLSGSLAK